MADRENDRVQVFDLDDGADDLTGLIDRLTFLFISTLRDVVIRLHNNMFSIVTLDGERLARWGAPIHRSIHGVWGDSERNIYVVQPGEWGRVRRVVKYTRR